MKQLMEVRSLPPSIWIAKMEKDMGSGSKLRNSLAVVEGARVRTSITSNRLNPALAVNCLCTAHLPDGNLGDPTIPGPQGAPPESFGLTHDMEPGIAAFAGENAFLEWLP